MPQSTWAKRRAQEGWIIFNDDAIVNALHSNQYGLYSKDLKPLYKSIENHIINFSIAIGKNVVIDRALDVNINSRKRWIVIGKSLDIKVNAVLFPSYTPEIHAKRRFESDNRGASFDAWLRVAKHHESLYSKPSKDEGFDEIIEYVYKE